MRDTGDEPAQRCELFGLISSAGPLEIVQRGFCDLRGFSSNSACRRAMAFSRNTSTARAISPISSRAWPPCTARRSAGPIACIAFITVRSGRT
jgi:hypothetical protein